MRTAFRPFHTSYLNIVMDIEVSSTHPPVDAVSSLRQLTEQVKSLVWMTDVAGNLIYLSRSVDHLFKPGTAVSFLMYLQTVHPEDRGRILGLYRDSTEAREEFQTDYRVVGLDCSIHWVTGSGAPRFTRHGEFEGYTGALIDVTDRYEVLDRLVNTRQALQKAKDEQSAILDSIGDAFFAVDSQWRITYANRKARAFIGQATQDIVGKTLFELTPGILASPYFPSYQKAMAGRENVFFEAFSETLDAWIEVRIYPGDDGLSIYVHDITAKRCAEEALRNSEQRFREIIEMTSAGYVLADSAHRIVDVNPALCKLSGYREEELIAQSLATLFAFSPWEELAFAHGGPCSMHGMETTVRHRDGRDIHVLFNGSVRRDGRGRAESVTGLMTDITARKETENRLEQLATHDTLTGLPNRALLNERLQQMLDFGPRNSSIAVMFIDLDRFKQVNDSFGHEAGDILLKEVSRRLKQALRPSDVIARLGGDEFVVATYCSSARHSAESIAAKLLGMLTVPVDIGDQEVVIGASIGISMFPQDGDTREVLFQNADTAMYRAKGRGRNGYCFFEAEMTVAAKTRMALELALRPALARREFELVYQPRIDLKTMSVSGMEALLRWNHPELGRVPPMQFIQIAEETGLIGQIGHWVLEEACGQARRLIEMYGAPLRLSVNLSARQLKCESIVEQVRSVLERTGFAPQLLELELTESALIEDIERSAGILKRLKALGIRLAVDDFGTGYSGLAYLRRFPLDVLKLDRSFVMQQSDGISSFEFIKAFVDMAHALKLSVVAEGVEVQDVLEFLCSVSCDEAQGYLLARPLSLPGLEAYLAGKLFAVR
jgi:diguanylate cyclase (GGDEF)-like protein/PAS domain S-box-containing protein